VDVRAIREVFPEVRLLRTFYFYTRGNGQKGQQYWFDHFRITRHEKQPSAVSSQQSGRRPEPER
jgi:hypothetical protein